jgi:hypothetical protein
LDFVESKDFEELKALKMLTDYFGQNYDKIYKIWIIE